MGEERLYTVGEIAKLCGVTVRTLQYYDRMGLLKPENRSEGGRRLYGLQDALRLQQILFYKGFGFSLEMIRDRLLSIDSAQLFAEVLREQKKIMEKQIVYLRKASGLIDRTVREIQNNGELSLEKVAAVVSATKEGDFLSFVINQFDWKDLKALMSGAQAHAVSATPERSFDRLMQRLLNLHRQNIDPLGEEGWKLASDWWAMVKMLTGDDPALVSTVLSAGSDLSKWPEEHGEIKLAFEHFLSPAMGNYFVKMGIELPEMEGSTDE